VLVFVVAAMIAPNAKGQGISSPGEPHYFATKTLWKSNAFPAAWNPVSGRIIFNRRGADSMFDAYSAAPDGSGETCLTCKLPSFPRYGANTHRGAQDVTPDGKYVVVMVEKPHPASPRPAPVGAPEAEPGRGIFNDIWLVASDGSKAWPLTNLPANAYEGQIWARLNRAGNKLVWSYLYAGGNETNGTNKDDLGSWQIKLADLVWSDGVPGLANTKTYEPVRGTFYEPYSFSADDSRFTFASPMDLPSLWDSQIWSISTSFTGLTRLTEQNDSNYNEFAHYTPAGDHIVVSRAADSWDTTHLGLDWWIMNADGSHQERLTYMNEPWNADSGPLGRLYSLPIPGGIAWDPHDPSRFIGGICTDNVCTRGDAWMVTLMSKPSGAGTGLKGEYFANASLTGTPSLTRVDATVGFRWNGSPGAPIPADGFSVRWTGSVQPWDSGAHSFCTYADDGARLWVGGTLVVDAWNGGNGFTLGLNRKRCGTVTLEGGQQYPIRMEFYDVSGAAVAKLIWSGPGHREEIIPAGQLFP
jgi:hypothetical protein